MPRPCRTAGAGYKGRLFWTHPCAGAGPALLGTAILDVALFDEPATVARCGAIGLILVGIVLLELVGPA